MKKTIISLVLLLTFICIPVFADGEIIITVDGEKLDVPQAPVMESDRVLVPMRAIFERLGAKVQWIEDVQTIFANTDKDIIAMAINSESMFVNSESVKLDVPPRLIGDYTMVPVRAVAEALKAEVTWDEASNTVIIKSAEEKPAE